MLCDWQSLTNGKYYHGHDIDRDLKQLRLHDNDLSEILWKARGVIFDIRLLGEFGGWSEPRGQLKGVYRDRRRLIHNFSNIKVVKML